MASARDYRAEYRRRVERGLGRGLTRSQARGHARATESLVSGRPVRRYDPELEEGIKQIRGGRSLSAAARILDVSPERLRRYVQSSGVARKVSGRWIVGLDRRRRVLPIFSEGRARDITVRDYESAAKVGRYMTAVGKFLEGNDPEALAPFLGDGVVDTSRRFHRFETDQNTLYRIALAEHDTFEQVYRIIA